MSEVTWADQSKINEFSKLSARQAKHEQALARLRQDKEYLDDTTLELELVDEDELMQYKIGDFFVELRQSEVVERLEKEQEDLDERIAKREKEAETDSSRMNTLKSELYAKFGQAINLERD